MAILKVIVLGILFTVVLACAPGARRGGMEEARAVLGNGLGQDATRPMSLPELPEGALPEDARRAAARQIVERARSAFEDGRYSDTAELLERAVAIDGSFTEGYLLLAYFHMMQGDGELALAFLDQAEQLVTDEPEYLAEVEILRGRILENLGGRQAAADAYRRALGLVPDEPRARAGLARVGDD